MLFLALFLLGIIGFLFRFVTADGDFTLMSKKHVKREAFQDKVVWITGASRGIGEVLAKQLATFGAKLILSARNEAELERVRQQLLSTCPSERVEVLPLDLASGEDSLKKAVEKAESLFSDAGVDYMIHNAAFERPKASALDTSEQSLKVPIQKRLANFADSFFVLFRKFFSPEKLSLSQQATFDVNVFGTISLTRLLAPFMLRRGRGHFVVMSSAAGKTPAPGQAAYSASKFALNGYFHTLRSELCQKGIKVTVVCPGPIETSNGTGTTATTKKSSSEKRLSSQRCAELTITAASHGLKEAWISYQPVLAVMYLVQYMPVLGYWLMDKVGKNRVEAAEKKGSIYSLGLLFGKKEA